MRKQKRVLNDNKKFYIGVALILILSFSFLAYDIGKPHEIWDERSRYVSGLNQVFNLVNGDFDSASWSLNYVHPPIGKYMYGFVNGAYLYAEIPNLLSISYDEAIKIVDETKNVIPGRYLAIILGSLSVLITFLIGRKLISTKVGAAAAMILLFSPVFIAHIKVENLESPLLFFFLATLYTFLKAYKDNDKKYYIISGILAGLAIGTKFNNFILLFLIPAFYVWLRYNDSGKLLKIFKNVPVQIWTIIPLALIVFFATWPWLWDDPIGNIQASLSWWLSTPPEYFLGNLGTAPLSYYFVYFFATMPLLFIIFFVAALVFIKKENKFAKLMIIWFALPLILMSLTSFKQNGPTYIYQIYPAFAIIAAIGLVKLFEFIKSRIGNVSILLPILTVVYISLTLAAIHPYYLDYYNEAVGGPKNVYENKMFVIGYQGEGLSEAVDYINRVAPPNSTAEFHFVPVHTTRNLRSDITDLNPLEYEDVLRLSNITEVDNEFHGADFVIENTYFRWYVNGSLNNLLTESFSYRLDKTVEAQGAPLVWVYRKAT